MRFILILLYMIIALLPISGFGADGTVSKRTVRLESGETVTLYYLSNPSAQSDSGRLRVYAKRPGISFLGSAVIPGAGQLYNGSMKRAAAFFALEVGLWTGFAAFRGKAFNKEDEYEALADKYWDFFVWIPGADNTSGHTIDVDLMGNPIKSDEYYENIGKYDKFNSGWDGSVNDTDATAERKLYLNLREDSNDLFALATTMANLVMFNHLISVADAVFTAKKLNDAASVQLSLKAVNRWANGEPVKGLSLSLSW
ncbi:MAG: hypothetical protein IH880_09825 [Candidatus Marinimicrobia bacterium]|nr:hypothetical protein [Candidatus Neomarinimicrobiota bacterium]